MPLIAPNIKTKFKDTIYNGLKREFSAEVSKGKDYLPIADEMWHKLADAISDIAMDIVEEIHSNAQVIPGQSVSIPSTGAPGTPSAGSVVSPGKIV